MTDRELMQMALEALGLFASDESDDGQMAIAAYVALRDRLSQPEPEHGDCKPPKPSETKPAKEECWACGCFRCVCDKSVPKPKREWVGLTDEEIYDYADKFLYQHGSNYGIKSFGKAIEAKLKEKNT